MTALAAATITPYATPNIVPVKRNYGIAASTTIYQGALVALNASGYAVPAATNTTLTPIGRFNGVILGNPTTPSGVFGDAVNSGSNGAFQVEVESLGMFMVNSGSDPVALADRGRLVYVVDDQTISKTDGSGTQVPAGLLLDLVGADAGETGYPGDNTALNGYAIVQVGFIDAAGTWRLIKSFKRVATFLKVAVDGAASTATAETPFFCAPSASTITAVKYVPAAALTGDGTNNASLSVAVRSAAGATVGTVASLTTTASWTAFVPVSLTAGAQTTIAAGASFTFAIAKNGTGVAVPAGVLSVEYTLS